MYKICFFVPVENAEQVKQSLFHAGAGKIGNYQYCSWQTKGIGQFCPMAGSQPYLGQHGDVETVEEYKVEMVCEDGKISSVVSALKSSHPYEEPAFEVYKLEDF